MGMKENVGSGYIVPVRKLIECLPANKQEEAEEALDNWSEGGLPEFIEIHLPEQFPQPVELFQLGDEDTPDENMERGEVYAIFDESDLYTKVEKPELKELRRVGIKPSFSNWSIFG
jgi:hypothetical protein